VVALCGAVVAFLAALVSGICFFLFCFEELGAADDAGHARIGRCEADRVRPLDGPVCHPSIWLEQFVTPGRNEFMQLALPDVFRVFAGVGGIFVFPAGVESVLVGDGRIRWWAYSIGYIIAIAFFRLRAPWFFDGGNVEGRR